jgi:predicted Zn-dependent peptidase
MSDPNPLASFRFTKMTLSNGLDVIVRQHRQHPIVAINLWYHVGSKNEERHQRGFTHLFEHLMFEGSAHYPGDFFKHLQPLGANINGSTSSDRTNYFVDLPTAHAERAMAMESDRMAHLLGALDQSKLRIQKDVVKNEYRQNYANRPYGMVWPLIAEALYPPQHPYSWMTIGVMEDLDRATVEDLSAFYRRFYVPSNASLAVVGDLDEDQLLALAARYFEPIPGGSRATRPWFPDARPAESAEIVLYDRVELDRLYLIWPTVPHFHGDDAALMLLGDVLARGRTSRLHRKLVLEAQIAQDVTAYQSGRELDGLFAIVVTLRPARSISEVSSLVESEVGSIASHGVTDDELRRMQNSRLASFCFALEHVGGFGGVADRLNAYNVYRGDPSLITRDAKRFQSVTAAELKDDARRYLDAKPRVSVSVVGRKKTTVNLSAPTGAPPTRAAVRYSPPKPEIITLASGAQLRVFPRRDLPTVAGAIVIRSGASLQQPTQAGLAHLTMVMLDEGTSTRSADEIALAVESMGASIEASCGWDGAYVSFRCLEKDLLPILDLTFDILLNPTFPDSEWERIRGQTFAALRAERDSAESLAYRTLLSSLFGEDHPYRFPLIGTESTVARIGRADLCHFHDQFLLSNHATIIVAGDVYPETLADELNRRFPASGRPRARLPEIAAPIARTRRRLLLIDRPGTAQAVVRAGHLGIARTEPAFEHILVLNQILGGQFTSRLNSKLREERGSTYGVRSQFDCRRQPGPFSINAAVAADRLAEALDDIRVELEAIKGSRPPTQVELDNARRALVEGHARHFETPSDLVNRCASLVIHDLPADHESGFADRLAAIELESLAAQAQVRIQPECLIAIVVADAEQVIESLKRVEWAQVERIDGP